MDITSLKKGTTIEELCSRIKETAIQAQLYHWAIKPSIDYALHMALGEFYEGLDDKIDRFVESAQGTYGRVFNLSIIINNYQYTNISLPSSFLMGFREYLLSARTSIPHSHLQNQIDEFLTLTNHIIYKITK